MRERFCCGRGESISSARESIPWKCGCAWEWSSRSPTRSPSRFSKTSPSDCGCRGINRQPELAGQVEAALRSAALWDEVKDRLNQSAYALSGGQQQRLCIARALAPEPEMLLFDEPTSALDPAATAHIEDLVYQLKDRLTIVIVTHNMQQAAHVSDETVFLYHGEVIEADKTSTIFENPSKELTSEYLTGRFG